MIANQAVQCLNTSFASASQKLRAFRSSPSSRPPIWPDFALQIRQAGEPDLIFGWREIAVMLQGNMADDEDVSTWIGYIIASNDVADQALIQEHRARSWAYAQTMQWVVGREGVTADAFDALQHENVLASELQLRIRARGFELMNAGAAPASEDQIAAWNATWVPLVSNLHDDATLGHWA